MTQSSHSWRLSCIEEEEAVELPDSTDDSDGEAFPPPPDFLVQDLDTAIYSKPDHTRNLEEEAAKLAIKKITGKYDSLGRLQKGQRYIETLEVKSMDDSYIPQRKEEYVFSTRYVSHSQDMNIYPTGTYPPKQPHNNYPELNRSHTSAASPNRYHPQGNLQTQTTNRYPPQTHPPSQTYQPQPQQQNTYQTHPQPQKIYQKQTPTSYPSQTPTSYPSQTPTSYPSQTPTSYPSQTPSNYQSQTSSSYQSQTPTSFQSQTQKGYHPPAQSKMLSEQEVMQVEMFFRSHKTEVYVCQCATHMYFGSVRSSPNKSPTQACPDDDSWTFFKNGVPVLVLDSGESRRSRRLSVVFAERSTGFILWKDTYNHLTNYRATHPSFHTLHLSNDHTKVVGFSFEDPGAASDFIRKIHNWTSDPNDSILNLSKKKKKKDDKKKKYKAPNKSDISSPCCFTHITQLDRSDGMTILGSSSAPTSPSRESMRTIHMSPIKMPKLVTMVPPNT